MVTILKQRKFFLLLLLLCLILAQPACTEIIVTGLDQMATPGVKTILRVKVERRLIGYLAPDLKDVTVEFLIASKTIGQATTDDEGIAAIDYLCQQTGVYEIDYRLSVKKYQRRPAKLYVVSPRQPAVVVDIDGTLSDYPDWKVPFAGDKAPAFHYAAEFLRRIAADYQIAYLTARDDIFDKITRAFLAKRRFPQGPIFYNELGMSTAQRRRQLRSKHHGHFKAGVIKRLQQNGVAIVAGIGNASTDAQAYLDSGIAAYIIKSDATINKQAIIFANYRQLAQIWAKRHDFSRRQVNK